MAKQLFLCLMAGMLVIAPGCTKRTKKIAPEHMSTEQLEKERKSTKTSGIALTTAGSIMTAGGAVASTAVIFIGEACRTGTALIVVPTVGILGLAACGAGVYMAVKGIDKLAQAKKMRRIQAKEMARQRKLEKEAVTEHEITQDDIENDIDDELASQNHSQSNLESERKKYKTRGIVLSTIAPIGMFYGAVMTNTGIIYHGTGTGLIVGGAFILGTSIYLLGQGIHDLAKAKTLRRIQMKEAARKRKTERELAVQDLHAEAIK